MKEVMKIRRSRKGAYDKRMRRSTRNTTTLILDLVTLTPAAVPHPAYYARLRTLTRESYRRVALRLASTRPGSPPIALFPRSNSARYVRQQLACICCAPRCLGNSFQRFFSRYPPPNTPVNCTHTSSTYLESHERLCRVYVWERSELSSRGTEAGNDI